VYIEALVALPIVFFFFVQTWQLCEFFSANLVLGHAAYAAARAAVVVGPDNPLYYDYDDVDNIEDGDGMRMEEVTNAAMIVASASPTLDADTLEVECALGNGGGPKGYYAPLEATVSADFKCPSWLSLVCLGSDSLPLEKFATFTYQGAGYEYE
jgi:hypothetical protein